jgi:hypothetical protein
VAYRLNMDLVRLAGDDQPEGPSAAPRRPRWTSPSHSRQSVPDLVGAHGVV